MNYNWTVIEPQRSSLIEKSFCNKLLVGIKFNTTLKCFVCMKFIALATNLIPLLLHLPLYSCALHFIQTGRNALSNILCIPMHTTYNSTHINMNTHMHITQHTITIVNTIHTSSSSMGLNFRGGRLLGTCALSLVKCVSCGPPLAAAVVTCKRKLV